MTTDEAKQSGANEIVFRLIYGEWESYRAKNPMNGSPNCFQRDEIFKRASAKIIKVLIGGPITSETVKQLNNAIYGESKKTIQQGVKN